MGSKAGRRRHSGFRPPAAREMKHATVIGPFARPRGETTLALRLRFSTLTRGLDPARPVRHGFSDVVGLLRTLWQSYRSGAVTSARPECQLREDRTAPRFNAGIRSDGSRCPLCRGKGRGLAPLSDFELRSVTACSSFSPFPDVRTRVSVVTIPSAVALTGLNMTCSTPGAWPGCHPGPRYLRRSCRSALSRPQTGPAPLAP